MSYCYFHWLDLKGLQDQLLRLYLWGYLMRSSDEAATAEQELYMVGAGVVRLNKFHQFSCLTWPFNCLVLVPIKFIQLPSTSGFKESSFLISVLLLRCLFGTFNSLVMHLVTNNHDLDAYVLSLNFRRWIHLGYNEDGTMSYDWDSLLYSDALQFHFHLSRPFLL